MKHKLNEIINNVVKTTLKEYYKQQLIPFATEKDAEGNVEFYGNDNGKKPSIYYFIDYLEHNGKYGRLPKASVSFEDLYDSTLDEMLEHAANSIFQESKETQSMILWEYLTYNDKLSDVLDLFELQYNQNFIVQSWDGKEYDLNDMDDFFSFFSNEHLEKFFMNNEYGQKIFKDALLSRLENYDYPDEIELDERGLVFVERVITIPDALTIKQFNQYDDFFQYLNKIFKGKIGEYWCWKKGFADAYWSDTYGGDYSIITLRGYVDPSSIDMLESGHVNIWDCQMEREIRLKDNGVVEIDEIIVPNANNVDINILQQPIIVKV